MQAYTSITFRTPAKILWKLMKYSYITVTLISWSKNRCWRFFEFRKSSNVKVVLHSRKSMYCNFIFSTERPTKKEFFKKKNVSQNHISSKVMPVFFFFTVTLSLTNYQNWGKFFVQFFYLGKFFSNILKNWHKMRKITA